MKKALLIVVLLVGTLGYGQALDQYQRLLKRSTADVNSIDTTRTDIVYTAIDSTLGIEVINWMDGNGWIPRITGGGGGIDWSTPVDATITFDADDTYNIGSASAAPGTIYYNRLFGMQGSNLSITDSSNEFRFDFLPTNNKLSITAYRKPASIWQINSQFEYDYVDGRWEIDDEAIAIGPITLSDVLADGNIMDANILLDSDVTRSIGNVTNALASIYNRSYIFKPQTSDPTYTVNLGQTFYRSDLGRISYWNGSEVKRLATTDDDQTLFLSGANNQFINISGGNSVDITGTINNITSTASNSFIKKNIRIATTANITLSGLQSIDGNTTADGERVLVKDQTDPKENGIYIASSGTWSRSPEAAISQNLARAYIYVHAGNTMYDKFFLTSFDRDDDIGVDDVIFTETPFDLSGGTSADGSITNAKLADNAVTSTKILDNTILNADINSGAGIDATKLIDGSITNTELGYINTLTSNAQTQISAKAPINNPTLTGNVVVPDADADGEAVNLGQLNTAVSSAALLGTISYTTARMGTLSDANGVIECNSASPIIYYVPNNSTVAHPVGTVLYLEQTGAGDVTLDYESGVTGEAMKTFGVGFTLSIRKTATNTWRVQNASPAYVTQAEYDGLSTAIKNNPKMQFNIVP